MKKLLMALVSVSFFSPLLFGIETDEPIKPSKPDAQKQILVFGDLGFSRNLNFLGKHDFFMHAGAQYQLSAGFFAEVLFNYHLTSTNHVTIANRTSYGIGLAALYKMKMHERFFVALKAGLLLHMNVSSVLYSSPKPTYTYSPDVGIQFGPGIEYLLSAKIGLRALATFNLLFSYHTPLWLGLTSGIFIKL